MMGAALNLVLVGMPDSYCPDESLSSHTQGSMGIVKVLTCGIGCGCRYKLEQVVRLHFGSSDAAFRSIYRAEDEEGHLVSLYNQD